MALLLVMVALTFFTLATGAILEKMPDRPTFSQFHEYIINHVVSKSYMKDQSSKTLPSKVDIERLFKLYNPNGNDRLSAAESKQVQEKLIDKINKLRIANIIVDFQKDFVTGSLAVEKAMEAVTPLKRLVDRHAEFQRFIYTKDWHPPNHISFYESLKKIHETSDPEIRLSDQHKYEEVKEFQTVHFNVLNPVSKMREDIEQKLYPTHCVQGLDGAEIIPELKPPPGADIVVKGFQRFVEAYSGFKETNLESEYLRPEKKKNEHIDGVINSGLALDICVAATALDAALKNYLTAVVLDCSKGLDNDQINKKLNELRSHNVAIIDSEEVLQFLNSRKVPWSWLCKIAGIPPNDTSLNTPRRSHRISDLSARAIAKLRGML